MFIGKYDKSVILSYIGALSAASGVILACKDKVTLAILCLIVAAVCDMFDGKVARMCKNRDELDKEYGKEIDSLCDVVSFLILPVAITISLTKGLSAWWIVALPLFVTCGVIRLAWFNSVTAKAEKVEHFTGVPVTFTAMLVPFIYCIQLILDTTFPVVYPISLLVTAILFIANIKIPKPQGVWYYIFSAMALIAGTAIFILG